MCMCSYLSHSLFNILSISFPTSLSLSFSRALLPRPPQAHYKSTICAAYLKLGPAPEIGREHVVAIAAAHEHNHNLPIAELLHPRTGKKGRQPQQVRDGGGSGGDVGLVRAIERAYHCSSRCEAFESKKAKWRLG